MIKNISLAFLVFMLAGISLAANVNVILDSSNGSSSFAVLDQATNDVTTINSLGNIYIKGNAGIGTTNPAQKLEVVGGMRASNASAVQGDIRPSNDGGGVVYVGANSNHPVKFISNNSIKGTILQNGNVGIGITNPAATLEVGTNHTLVVNAVTGNVGIGMTNPNSTLQINGPIATPIRTVTSTVSATSSDSIIIANNGAGIAINLPTASGIAGRQYYIKRVNLGSVLIDPFGAETIDSISSKVLTSINMGCLIVSDGTAWWTLTQY